MVKFDFLKEKILIREKEEWRCASMECGVLCVQMDGMKLLLVLSALSLDMRMASIIQSIYICKYQEHSCYTVNRIIIIIQCHYYYFTGLSLTYSQITVTPMLFHNITCNETHSMLFQCINLHSIGIHNCGGNATAGVVCLNTIVTATPTSVGLSNTYNIAILSGSLGTVVLAIIGIVGITIIIVYIQRMKLKRYLKVFMMRISLYFIVLL